MKRKKSTIILSLGLALFLTLGFLAKGEKPPHADRLPSEPIWQITKSGTDEPVNWEDHAPNPRFAIYNSGTPEDETDDLVLDKETGLVWERNPSDILMEWVDIFYFCYGKSLGGRMGWRPPTVEELTSLLDPNQGLPFGHPFIVPGNAYWVSTPYNIEIAFTVNPYGGTLGDDFKTDPHPVWCVRGGKGNKQ